jgi:hypothetical protein
LPKAVAGNADTARDRLVRMSAVTDEANPNIAAFSAYHEAYLSILMGEFSAAEARVTLMVELSVKHQ